MYVILECFRVKRSTFYCWKQECKNSQKRDEIADKIEQLCMGNHFIYGYRTITRLLKKVNNLVVNRKKVYRIMKEKGCLCRVCPKKGPKLGKPYHVTDNKLDRDFQADKPMEKLVTDITYLYFRNCRLYLSSIMDLYNREIVVYTISECQDTDFVINKLHQLELAQGVFYRATKDFSTPQKPTIRLVQKKASPAPCPEKEHQQIMPVSNGSILFSSLKPFYLHKWRNLTKDSITDIVKNYIIFYNETRIQQKLNDQSPVEYRKLVA